MGAEPVWDGHYYDFGARRIADGLGYSDDVVVDGGAGLAPVVPLPRRLQRVPRCLLPRLRRRPAVAPVVNALAGALLALVTWLLARDALDGRARAAGLLVALYPGLILYSALVMTEPLAALLTLPRSGSPSATRSRAACSLGALVLGVAALVRPQALLCAPFLAMLVPRTPERHAAHSRPRRRRRIAASSSCACSRSSRSCRGPRATAA